MIDQQTIKTGRDLQIAFREQLKELVMEQYEVAQAAGLNTAQAAGMVAEECMHMAAWFVARGSAWNADQFTDECRKLFEFHKDVAAKENRRPN